MQKNTINARFRDEIYESLHDAEAKRLYVEWRSIGSVLNEATLTQKQIQDIFAAIEAGVKSGQNVDAPGGTRDGDAPKRGIIGSISQAWTNFKDKISKSDPVSGFDIKFNNLQQKLLAKAGGKQGVVGKMLNAYQVFGQKYPRLQSAILYGLTIAAAASGWGLGGLAIVSALRGLDSLLRGERFSSAAWKAIKNMALGALASQIFPIDDGDPPPKIPDPVDTSDFGPGETPGDTTYTVRQGDTLSDIAARTHTSVDSLTQANPQITNPDVLRTGQEIKLTPAYSGEKVYQGGVGTAADTLAKIKSGVYTDSPISQAQAAKYGLRESIDYARMKKIWANQAQLKLPQLSAVYLTPIGVAKIFEACEKRIISEGIFDKLFKNTITAEKLNLFWKKNFGEYPRDDSVDVGTVIQFLRRMGVKDGLIQKTFADLKIPTAPTTPQEPTFGDEKINTPTEPTTPQEPTFGDETTYISKNTLTAPTTEPTTSTEPTTEPTTSPKPTTATSTSYGEIEFPGTNVVFKPVTSWVTVDGNKPASDAASDILNRLASGVSKSDLDSQTLISARRNLYAGAPGMTEQKRKLRKRI